MKKKALSLLLAACMVFGLAACGSSSAPEASTENATTSTTTSTGTETNQAADAATTVSTGEKELAVQIGPDPETIDPALNSAVDGGNMLLHSHECLLIVDQDGKLQPGQAESYEVSEDGLTWTFHLREGLKWSDGSDLTANDFVYSWKRVCDPMVAAPYAETVLGMVKGYEDAICVNLDDLAVTSPETYFSNGPFYMTEWVPGSHITFSKNPYYWNADAIKLDRLKFVLMEDSNAAYSAYQTGEVLMIKDVPTEEIPSLEGNSDFYVDPIIGTYYVSLNIQRAPFDNADVRKALSLAIDREYVAGTLMQGTYSAASNFMGPGWIDTDGTEFMANANGGNPYIDTTNHEANLEEAKQLLADAGYPDGEGFPTITYTTNDAGYHKVVAEYLQQAWAELGIDLQVNIVEWSSFTPMRRNGEFDAARNGWVGDYSDPSNMIELFYTTNGNNDGKFSNADFDAAIDLSRTTLDAAERSKALHTAEDILMEEAGCIPIAYYNDFWLQSEKITGSWHSAYGYWYFMYADIAE